MQGREAHDPHVHGAKLGIQVLRRYNKKKKRKTEEKKKKEKKKKKKNANTI
jgi:hypothetical protein